MPNRNIDWTTLLSTTTIDLHDYMFSIEEPFVIKNLVIDDIQDQDISFNGATQSDRKSTKGAKIMPNYQHTFDLKGRQFQITRAGLLELTKAVLKMVVRENEDYFARQRDNVISKWWNTNEYKVGKQLYPPQIVDICNMYFNVYDNLYRVYGLTENEKRVLQDLRNELYNKASDAWYDFPRTYYYMNMLWITNVITTNRGYAFKSETFELNGHYYTRDLHRFVSRCPECGNLFLEQNGLEDYLTFGEICGLISSDIGYNGHCPSCVEYFDEDYGQCEVSGLWVDRDDLRYVENTEQYVSERAIDHGDYQTCESCGALIDLDCDNDGYWTDDNCFFCCSDCAENEGYHWSEDRECYTQENEANEEVDELIPDYHSHRYYIPIFSKKDRPHKHNLFIGRELEVDGQDRYDYDVDYYEELSDMLRNENRDQTCFFETDSSVEFEIISQPMTEKAFFEMDWEKANAHLREGGWKSHDAGTCGLHYHFSSWYLGYNNRQKRDSARKICRFIEDHWDDIVKFSRRKDFGYCDRFYYHIDKDTSWDRLTSNRYRAVNLQNLFGGRKDTIEIRICRGTLNTETQLASADFFLHIVRNAKSVPWNKIDDLSLWFKGIKNKNTINYIKSRNCFEGAF